MPQHFRLDRTRGPGPSPVRRGGEGHLRQLLTGWLAEYGTPVLVVRGFSSQPYADLVRHRLTHEHREVVLAYVGDFDCSEADIERGWVQRTGCWARVQRIALIREQVLAYGLPAAEGKKDAPRWPAFARTHGFDVDQPVQWEVGAIDPYLDRQASWSPRSTPTSRWAGPAAGGTLSGRSALAAISTRSTFRGSGRATSLAAS